MQMGYVNTATYPLAIAAAYVAKKAAEIAPGVGTATDMHVVFKDHIEILRPDIFKKSEELYVSFEKKRSALSAGTVEELRQYIALPLKEPENEKRRDLHGEDAKANEGASQPAAEAPRGNESGASAGEAQAAPSDQQAS
jgi:hypothetical protein